MCSFAQHIFPRPWASSSTPGKQGRGSTGGDCWAKCLLWMSDSRDSLGHLSCSKRIEFLAFWFSLFGPIFVRVPKGNLLCLAIWFFYGAMELSPPRAAEVWHLSLRPGATKTKTRPPWRSFLGPRSSPPWLGGKPSQPVP